MREWTCHHCGQKFTHLTGGDGLVYHRQRCDGTGECSPPQPPQEAKRKANKKVKKRKKGRPKKQPSDPLTRDDKKWIRKNWT